MDSHKYILGSSNIDKEEDQRKANINIEMTTEHRHSKKVNLIANTEQLKKLGEKMEDAEQGGENDKKRRVEEHRWNERKMMVKEDEVKEAEMVK